MTDQQRKNLATLCLYCKNLPPDYDGFDMRYYVTEGKGYQSYADLVRQPKKMGCGTAACFAGHGPNAGIRPLHNLEPWYQYVERAFGCVPSSRSVDDPWNWLFNSNWPNSVGEAIKRAAWLLEGHMVPEVGVEEEYDDEKEEEVEVLQWVEPDGFSTFTPNWDKITKIANS